MYENGSFVTDLQQIMTIPKIYPANFAAISILPPDIRNINSSDKPNEHNGTSTILLITEIIGILLKYSAQNGIVHMPTHIQLTACEIADECVLPRQTAGAITPVLNAAEKDIINETDEI